MDIDWSKAPEGATHRVPHGCWYKIEDGLVWCWSSRDEWAGPYPKKQYEDGSMEDMVKRPKTASEWNGEGLPPVDLPCEWHSDTQTGWQEVVVLAYSGESAWIQPKGRPSIIVGNPANFRQIRTPEQIAAEEIQRIRDEIGYQRPQLGVCPVEAMYNLGYRKFEIVEGE